MDNSEKSKQIRYTFEYVDYCNMCKASNSEFKILGKRLNTSQGLKPHRKVGIATTICKCKNCDLIFSNPLPIPYDLQDHYGVSPEAYWTDDYFQVHESYFSTEIARSKELLNFKRGMKSLDIGAGIGKSMISLTNAGFDAFGLEPSQPFHDAAISKMGIDKDKLKLGAIEEVEYPEEEFDFITFGVVLEHLYDPSNGITKAMKWLKPNGIIHVEVPSSNWLVNKMINTAYKFLGSDFIGNLSPMHSPFHLYEFGFKSFEKHAEQNGYAIAFHEYFVCNTYMPKAIDFFIKPYMRKTDTGMQLCIYLKKKA